MAALLEIKEKLKNIYGRYDIYLNPFFKFVLALSVFSLINGNIGYMEKIRSIPFVLVVSLACSLLSVHSMILLAGIVILLHLYALAIEVAAVACVLFLMILLLYFRFAPKDGIYAIFMPLCLSFRIGPVMPLVTGLLGRAYSALSLFCGTLVWFFLNGVKQNAAALGSSSEDAAATAKLTMVLKFLAGNKEMYLVAFSCIFVTLLVFVIRKMSIDYAWTAAIIVGALVNFILLFAGYILLGISGRLPGLVLGSLLSLAAALVLEFLFFNLDYSRTERVQFEDDEYYYYVKAVPKIYVAEKEKRIQTFHAKDGRANTAAKRPPVKKAD